MVAVSPGSMLVAKKTAKETMSSVITAITSRFPIMLAISEFMRDLQPRCPMTAAKPLFHQMVTEKRAVCGRHANVSRGRVDAQYQNGGQIREAGPPGPV
jgi:hypothetical protein